MEEPSGSPQEAMEGAEASAPAHAQAPLSAKKQLPKKLSRRKLEKLKEAHDKRGIVYISRIPPHLKPQKLRQMLEQHAELGRLYLAPEDPSLRRQRKRKGGDSGKNFTEGWVEFVDKRQAKRVAALLNGQPMGGRRRSAHYYDLWALRYLPGFKWDALTEEINYQRAVREQRLAAEVSAAKRERDFYLSRVDRAKAAEAMAERRAKRGGGDAGGGEGGSAAAGPPGGAGDATGGSGPGGERALRTFGQRRAKLDPVNDPDAPVLSEGLLRLIAGRKARARDA